MLAISLGIAGTYAGARPGGGKKLTLVSGH